MTGRTSILRESKMTQLHSISSVPSTSGREQVVDTMVELTRLSNLHRTIIAGSGAPDLYLSLRRRGFIWVSTMATCRVPKGQHAVGLISGQNSLQAIETALTEISHYLSASAAIAVMIDSRESGSSLRIRARLEQIGFRIEAGVRCQQGFVLSAYRHGFGQMEKAA
jgi:hypothetical protein